MTITILILTMCGIVVNMTSALFGIGGGVLMVPILRTLFPEFPMQVVANLFPNDCNGNIAHQPFPLPQTTDFHQ